jgi:hydrogen peroxide-dependent heme synthase
MTPVTPHEGWHVLHLFYSVERSAWSMLASSERFDAMNHLIKVVDDIKKHKNTQLLTFSMVTPKADIGFMILTDDLQRANEYEKRLTMAMGGGVLQPVYSYLSMTERSEYTTTEEEYSAQIVAEGHAVGTPAHDEKMAEFQTRMKKYGQDRLYPNMSDWPVFCFYPMSKRREVGANWFAATQEARKKMMEGHARVGRRYAGKIRQLITGSTGLDEHEWFVTLQAKDTYEIKAVVYEMRFDEVSAVYADFGDFLIGLQLSVADIFKRLALRG